MVKNHCEHRRPQQDVEFILGGLKITVNIESQYQ